MVPDLHWFDLGFSYFHNGVKAMCIQEKPYFEFSIWTSFWASDMWYGSLSPDAGLQQPPQLPCSHGQTTHTLQCSIKRHFRLTIFSTHDGFIRT